MELSSFYNTTYISSAKLLRLKNEKAFLIAFELKKKDEYTEKAFHVHQLT